MRILVCIKHVPDTETKVKVSPDGKGIDEAGVKWVISPYDEFALEEALRLVESAGEGEVVVATAGREAAQASLRQALAMGAHRAVHVKDDAYDAAEAIDRARALAAVVEAENAELVFTGKIGVGSDEGQTGPMLAHCLGWPQAGAVDRLEVSGGAFTAHRSVEGAVEILEGTLPAVVTWDKGEHEPRYPSLKGIMAAKKKPLVVKTPAELGVEPPKTPRIAVESLELPPARPAGRVLEGDAASTARELARLLREEAKVI